MRRTREELGIRLAAFALDEQGVTYPFSQRLAREHGWRRSYVRRVIEEYKRFLYLTQVAEHPVCPSEQVDQVWHLHLTFTHSYWDELCGRVLERPLHHVPTRGGTDEQAKHRAMYEQTLRTYRREFGAEPPADIWPPTERRFRDESPQRVNRQAFWLVPKPRAWFLWRQFARRQFARRQWQWGSGGLVVVPLLAAVFNPFDLPGPAFLGLFAGAFVFALILAWFVRRIQLTEEWRPRDTLGPYELACLAHDPRAAVQTAIVKLLHEGSLQLHPAEGGSAESPISDATLLVKGDDLVGKAEELEAVLQFEAGRRGGITFAELKQTGLPIAERIRDRLQDEGLLLSSWAAWSARWWPALIVWSVAALGLVKVIVGLQRHKPVGFLVIGICWVIGIGFLFLRQRQRTIAGDRLLNEQRAAFRPRLEEVKQPTVAPTDLALGVALFGSAVLLGGPLAFVEPLWAADRLRGFDSSSTGSGCGGDSGGGGCGGGGGGSGCGGCGGGGD